MLKTNLTSQQLGLSNSPGALAEETRVRDIRGPVPIPNVWLWVGWGLALLLLLALLAWWWKRNRRSQHTPALPPPITPHEKARAKLREALDLLDQPRPFCILVSDTIRVYLEERFKLRAPERTTEEFLEELQTSPLLGLDQKRILGEFLMGCDLVKFARYQPGRPELEGIYDSALRLVEETQPAAPLGPGPVPAGPAQKAE